MNQSEQEFRMQPATKEDLSRLEETVRDLATAVKQMILIDERQKVQGERIGSLEKQNAALVKEVELLQRKVDSWINRGVGAWGVLTVLALVIGWAVEGKR